MVAKEAPRQTRGPAPKGSHWKRCSASPGAPRKLRRGGGVGGWGGGKRWTTEMQGVAAVSHRAGGKGGAPGRTPGPQQDPRHVTVESGGGDSGAGEAGAALTALGQSAAGLPTQPGRGAGHRWT